MRPSFFILFLSLWLACARAASPLELYHRPPGELVEGVPVQLEVIPPDTLVEPEEILLHLRQAGQLHYQDLAFHYEGGTYSCTIPAAFLRAPVLEYFISATFQDAGFAALPAEEPDQHPLRIPVKPFDAFQFQAEGLVDRERIESIDVIPWHRSSNRPNRFPIRYFPKPGDSFVEMGYIRIKGNRKASVKNLLEALFKTARQEGAHGVTDLKIGVYTGHAQPEHAVGVLTLEAVYIQRRD